MKTIAIKCASCGAALNVTSESTRIVRCSHCDYVNKINYKGETEIWVDGTESHRSNLRTFMNKRLRSIGLDVGAQVSLAGEVFNLIGGLEFSYEDGFFVKFVLRSNNPLDIKDYFLMWDTEFFGLYAYEKRSGITEKRLKKMEVGKSFKTEMGDKIVVDEKGKAKIISFAGEVPFVVDEDEEIEYFDGYFLNKDGLFTIDKTKNRFQVYFGKEIDAGDIKVLKEPP